MAMRTGIGVDHAANESRTGTSCFGVLGLVAMLLTFACPADAPAQGHGTDPGRTMTVGVAGAKILADGALSLPGGDELVIGGLDMGLGLTPATKAYEAEIRRLAGQGPWRVIDGRRDRYNRLTGRIETVDGEWIQERLLRLGFVRFAGGIDDVETRRALLLAEGAARAEKRGVWRNPRYLVRAASQPDEIYNGFQIVEGQVRGVGRAKGVVFLNFGEDWREDFTAGITVRLQPKDIDPDSGHAAGASPLRSIFDIEGRTVRLRGMVRRYNGPYMEIADADQIELIGDGRVDPVTLRSAGPSDPPPASGWRL